MEGTVPTADTFSVTNLIQSKEVTNGREWVENTNKKWYKPWTWFQEKDTIKQNIKLCTMFLQAIWHKNFCSDKRNCNKQWRTCTKICYQTI